MVLDIALLIRRWLPAKSGVRYHPSGYIPAENVEDHIQVKVVPFIAGPNNLVASHDNT